MLSQYIRINNSKIIRNVLLLYIPALLFTGIAMLFIEDIDFKNKVNILVSIPFAFTLLVLIVSLIASYYSYYISMVALNKKHIAEFAEERKFILLYDDEMGYAMPYLSGIISTYQVRLYRSAENYHLKAFFTLNWKHLNNETFRKKNRRLNKEKGELVVGGSEKQLLANNAADIIKELESFAFILQELELQPKR